MLFVILIWKPMPTNYCATAHEVEQDFYSAREGELWEILFDPKRCLN